MIAAVPQNPKYWSCFDFVLRSLALYSGQIYTQRQHSAGICKVQEYLTKSSGAVLATLLWLMHTTPGLHNKIEKNNLFHAP